LVSLSLNMADINEKELIKMAQRDPEVFGNLYDRYYPQIFGYILKRTANLETTQDITSETFLKALKNIWQFRWQGLPFSSWLYRIATNEITNYFRKNGKIKTVSLQETSELKSSLNNPHEEYLMAEEELEKNQNFLFVKNKILALSSEYQEVITLKFFEKKQIKEIAEILNKKTGTVKSLLSRGLEKLRTMVQES